MRVEVGAGGVAGEERLLDDVPLEVQEAWLCEDLLFVLQVSIPKPLEQPSEADMLNVGHRGLVDSVR